MAVLVAYATRHGSTAGIAERIAARLTERGFPAESHAVDKVGSLETYDAVVLGAATYMFHWHKDAVRFAHQHADVLGNRPLWLFSSGPLGTEQVDAAGHDVREGAVPKEFPDLIASLGPRGTQVFFGAYDPEAKPVGLAERVVRSMPASGDLLKPGDFRDWEAIDAWADDIADQLGAAD